MPIQCAIEFTRLSTDEMRGIDYDIMKHAFRAHREIGCCCDEVIYESRLKHLLIDAGYEVETQVPVTLSFRDVSKRLFLDLTVNRSVIYELKTVTELAPKHVVQLLDYLFLTNASRGKLLNFRPQKLETKFVNSTMEHAERRRFRVDAAAWRGPSEFCEMVEALVADWGAGLEHSLYLEAVVHCLGGKELVTRQVPMKMGGENLGNQRFHLLGEHAAIRVTTFQDDLVDQRCRQFRKMIGPSPLTTLHWINIARHQVRFLTIGK